MAYNSPKNLCGLSLDKWSRDTIGRWLSDDIRCPIWYPLSDFISMAEKPRNRRTFKQASLLGQLFIFRTIFQPWGLSSDIPAAERGLFTKYTAVFRGATSVGSYAFQLAGCEYCFDHTLWLLVLMSVKLLIGFAFCLFDYRLCRETQTLSCVFGKKLVF